jgi:hypothetical protein
MHITVPAAGRARRRNAFKFAEAAAPQREAQLDQG